MTYGEMDEAIVLIICEVTGATVERATEAREKILALEKVKEALDALYREDSYSSIYDGEG